MLPCKGISDTYKDLYKPRPVWPSPELSGENHLWMQLQGDVEGPLDTIRQYLHMHLQIAWDKAAKTVYCFWLHIKGVEWKAEGM